MPYYESVFIARQEISTQQVDALADAFCDVIDTGGGKVTKRENWGLKTLAYKIKKSRKAHYTLFNIDAPAEAVHEMERQMRLNEDVLRYMTIRLENLSDEPSIQVRNIPNQSDGDNNNGEFKARPPEERKKMDPSIKATTDIGNGPETNQDPDITVKPSSNAPNTDVNLEQKGGKNEPTE